ncbi:hypothetical protein M409DRAFT_21850 [Zasmidium cellare ATCC 36951]|uniref:Uncharacterized protein n=1 Tax=Zasmidium cellare ATCC 36951 TaxID=1080233 RepID=A0A6A6CKD0_ZASCE|nr:uncharacterized protein M409DRAFT_21850 [Zasmidium cellare ATCC 36951]KAF2167697.1 hypothetical protein M409DRAFT_21850 [Zasmidium cellare ATCC 36951]
MAETDKTTNEDQQAWDIAKHEAALAHFEKLQDQLDALRAAIPSIVAPLKYKSATKPRLFADIKDAAVTASTDLKDFRENWTSEQTQSLLARADESKQKDGDFSKAVTVPRYGWIDGR